MPFDIPPLAALIKRAHADLAPQHGSESLLRRADTEVLARVHAGASFGLYAHQKWIADQILIDRCDPEMVLRLAALRLPQGRRPGVAATGKIRCTGQTGRVIDAGSLWQSPDGRRYRAIAPATITAGQAIVSVQAQQAGAAGNLEAGALLSAVSPILGVTPTATLEKGGLQGGSNEEDIETLRERVKRTYRYLAHGGNADDYVTWALEAPGVTRAWTRAKYMGPGTVGVFFMRDNDADPFPGESACAAMQAHLEQRRPVTAEVYALAPRPLPIHYEIHLTPDTSALRRAVEASLRALILAEAALGAPLLHTHQSAAISESPGEKDHVLYAPTQDVVAAANELPVFGDITWR